jgi:hypothetical protein
MEHIGVNLGSNSEIDRDQFLQIDAIGDRGDERKYTPKFDISPDIHPFLYRYIIKTETTDNNERNRMILHLFECWIIAIWARGPGANSVNHTNIQRPTKQDAQSNEKIKANVESEEEKWFKQVEEERVKGYQARQVSTPATSMSSNRLEEDDETEAQDNGSVIIGGERVGGTKTYKTAKKPSSSPLNKYNQKK